MSFVNMAKTVKSSNPTWSGRIPSIKKTAVDAIRSLMPKKRSRKSILDSDDEISVHSISASIYEDMVLTFFLKNEALKKKKKNFVKVFTSEEVVNNNSGSSSPKRPCNIL